jgi:hypothetical protein
MKRFTALLACLAAAAVLAAAQDVSFTVTSSNSAYTADIIKKPDRSYMVEVYDARSNRFEWDSWVEWNEKKVPYLSNDGRYFVLITPAYAEDENVIEIYRDGLPYLFNGKVLNLRERDLRKDSVGKYIWIYMNLEPVRFNYSAKGKTESLELDLVTGKTVMVPFK